MGVKVIMQLLEQYLNPFKLMHPFFRVLRLYVINFAILIVAYSSLFVVPHFSTDTYDNYITTSGNDIMIHVRHGRFISALLYQIFELIHFDYKKFVTAGCLIFIAVCAWGATVLIDRFHVLLENKGIEQLIALDIVMLSMVLNTSIMEDLLFPDVSFSYAICFLFCFASTVFWCKENKIWTDYFLSFFFLCLTLNMYQVCIGFYVIVCLSYTVISKNFSSWKSIFPSVCGFLSIGVFASLISLICMKIPSYIGVSSSEYVGELSFGKITSNAEKIVLSQKGIWFGFSGFLPWYAPILFFVVVVCLFFVSMWQSEQKPSIWLLCVLGFLGSWFMSFAPYFIAEDVWMPPRTLFSLFAFLALPGLWTVAISSKRTNMIITLIYGSFLLVMAIGIQKVSINNYAGNKVDQEICNIIICKIEEYEQETGNVIDKIAVCSDGNLSYGYAGISYTIYDTNLRCFSASWGDVSAIEFYSGRDFQRVEMTAEEYQKFFGNQSWDYFDSEEQIYFEDTTMYLAIY